MATIRKSTNNVCPAIAATIASGVLTVMLGPASFLLWPVFFAAGKKDAANYVDESTEDDSYRIIDQARQSGVRSMTLKQTVGSNGALFNLPVTRTYHVDFDDE